MSEITDIEHVGKQMFLDRGAARAFSLLTETRRSNKALQRNPQALGSAAKLVDAVAGARHDCEGDGSAGTVLVDYATG